MSMDEICALIGRKDLEIYLARKREAALHEHIKELESREAKLNDQLKSAMIVKKK
jgi:hypothetical protein